jgi:DNA-binding MarR family transcriptional regulator
MSGLDKLIHERARLLILTYLAGSDETEVSFNELKDELALTPGNLSVQIGKLKDVKFVTVNKTFRRNKPYTTVSLTARGAEALDRYLEEMEKLIQSLRK